MFTQIYSIQTVEEALECVRAGVDYIGVASGTGAGLPAEISLEQGRAVFDAARGRIGLVALTVADGPDPIYEMARALDPDVVHLCGNNYAADPAFCADIRRVCPGILVEQAISVTGPEAVDKAEYFASFCDTLILDSSDPNISGIGASGIVNDWDVCAKIVKRVKCRVILAGGLGPDNVAEAIAAVRPWGVDSMTRTNRALPDGSVRKDAEKVRAFVRAAREAALKWGL
ncbi:MAG: phosphoribosylanthranilate isomerase [Clostridiales bacterium]|jgi:phosphoribosylanthranilate isomerase|nr:phosphoribosylanthranilate isomerase [Clostridiales bacterium]